MPARTSPPDRTRLKATGLKAGTQSPRRRMVTRRPPSETGAGSLAEDKLPTDLTLAPGLDPAPDPDPAPAAGDTPVRRRRGLVAALGIALVAVLVALAVIGNRWYDQRQLATARQEALAAARQTTVNFVSVSAATVDRDLQRVTAGATGDFKDEFTRGAPQVRAAIVENNVDSRGSVLRAGLVSSDRDSAVALVAVDATVKNVKAPQGRLSHYRIQVDLARDAKSGRWLVSKLQFVG
jgi:Mce-associated membrane protein